MEKLLKKYFGYDQFRTGQKEIIENILKGSDVLAIMPTGAGKSICYQIPALMQDGITLVISPLISLMKDQVDALSQTGIKAAYINSTLSMHQMNTVIDNARKGMYKLIYVAPERLESDSFHEMLRTINVSMVAVDEAHCVSQWGHDFRPSYTKIAKLVNMLPQRPVVTAFTATATPQVKDDIINLLKLNVPFTLTTGFDRENLYFEVLKPKNKGQALLECLKKKRGQSGIIYASTRKTVEAIYDRLLKDGYSIAKYHAGLSEQERTASQEAFIYDRVNLMAATNAFGMGIDKSNISFVIHYNMPKNMESYYQEAGRAGRDGERAECIMFFSASDIIMNKLLIENSGENADRKQEYRKLKEIVDYCNTDKCLREYILSYFGERLDTDNCRNCGNCNNDLAETDITVEVQKILSTIKRMNERFGSGLVTEVLRGSNTKKVRELGFDRLTTYGIMKDYSADTIKEIISYLIAEGYLFQSDGQYPVLKIASLSLDVLCSEKRVMIKRVIEKEKTESKESEKADNGLFEALRMVRMEIAKKEKVPPFMIFSDATLKDMCKRIPGDRNQMLKVSGVGNTKLDKYGGIFIEAIHKYADENNILTSQDVSEDAEQKTDKNRESRADTKIATYKLYKAGLSISEIAAERDLTIRTVEEHLLDCASKGMEIDESLFLKGEWKAQIIEAIRKCGSEKLKPIKESLPDEISYLAIKYVLLNIG